MGMDPQMPIMLRPSPTISGKDFGWAYQNACPAVHCGWIWADPGTRENGREGGIDGGIDGVRKLFLCLAGCPLMIPSWYGVYILTSQVHGSLDISKSNFAGTAGLAEVHGFHPQPHHVLPQALTGSWNWCWGYTFWKGVPLYWTSHRNIRIFVSTGCIQLDSQYCCMPRRSEIGSHWL